MADAKLAPNKLAMSRALGAAFLNHQVEQLEKSVHTNWRERRSPDNWRGGEAPKRTYAGPKVIKKRNDVSPEERGRFQEGRNMERTDREGERRSEENRPQKDADVVIVDASVLVHGLYHLKKWCRDGREEVVIVPLEGKSAALLSLDPRLTAPQS